MSFVESTDSAKDRTLPSDKSSVATHREKNKLIVAISAGVIVVLIAIGAVLYFVLTPSEQDYIGIWHTDSFALPEGLLDETGGTVPATMVISPDGLVTVWVESDYYEIEGLATLNTWSISRGRFVMGDKGDVSIAEFGSDKTVLNETNIISKSWYRAEDGSTVWRKVGSNSAAAQSLVEYAGEWYSPEGGYTISVNKDGTWSYATRSGETYPYSATWFYYGCDGGVVLDSDYGASGYEDNPLSVYLLTGFSLSADKQVLFDGYDNVLYRH